MRIFLKKTVFVFTVLLATSAFVSCDSLATKNKKAPLIVAEFVTPILEDIKEIIYQKPIVFIAGFDKGTETFYGNARNYFEEKGLKIIEGQYSLEEIIVWLNAHGNLQPFSEIHIVNKSNPYTGMHLETVVRGDKITPGTLRRTIAQGTLPKLKSAVNNNTKIIFHAAGLLENKALLETLKDAFRAKENPKVLASPYHTIFGGKFSNHYLAKPYYIFYPTAHSPGKTDLSKEIAKKYPEEKDIDWYNALSNGEERYIGEAYTTQFTIPIKWEFDYYNSDTEMPNFTSAEEIMDWIETKDELLSELEKCNIAVEKFRWNWSVKGDLLVIRGRTSGLCVLKPLIKPYGDLKHVEPDTSNKRLYATK
jgi:hypothetical protein